MKKLLLSLVAISFITFNLSAQETDPAKLLKNAKKAFSSYSLDPQSNGAKLAEAATAIDAATKMDANNIYEAWLTAGNIYAEMANKDDIMRSLKKDAKATNPTAPLNAYNAFTKAYALAVKKYEKSDAIKGLSDNQNRLQNYGADCYSNKDFSNAYSAFGGVAIANTTLTAAKEKNVMSAGKADTLTYYAALCAQSANMMPEAEASYKSLLGKNFGDEAACYSALYGILSGQKKKDEAIKLLSEGIAKHPNATDLLFAQINYYLSENKLSELIDKLKIAIEKEPKNIGLYTTLGNVYDNLASMELKAGNTAKVKEYNDAANKVYGDALAKDPNNFDANYSVGAAYYNKAAGYTEALNKFNDDYSDAGVKKYEALKEEMNGVFKQALPYFQKAESINANDRNTLIALKEILIRLNMMTESSEIKNRMDILDAGKKNEKSYFKN